MDTFYDDYTCEICGETGFQTKNAILNHQKDHDRELKPFPCPLCDTRFKKPNYLRKHFVYHLENNPYICEIPKCFKKFSNSAHLAKHVALHTSRKFVTCPTCSKQLSTKFILKDHIQRFHSPEANPTKRIYKLTNNFRVKSVQEIEETTNISISTALPVTTPEACQNNSSSPQNKKDVKIKHEIRVDYGSLDLKENTSKDLEAGAAMASTSKSPIRQNINADEDDVVEPFTIFVKGEAFSDSSDLDTDDDDEIPLCNLRPREEEQDQQEFRNIKMENTATTDDCNLKESGEMILSDPVFETVHSGTNPSAENLIVPLIPPLSGTELTDPEPEMQPTCEEIFFCPHCVWTGSTSIDLQNHIEVCSSKLSIPAFSNNEDNHATSLQTLFEILQTDPVFRKLMETLETNPTSSGVVTSTQMELTSLSNQDQHEMPLNVNEPDDDILPTLELVQVDVSESDKQIPMKMNPGSEDNIVILPSPPCNAGDLEGKSQGSLAEENIAQPLPLQPIVKKIIQPKTKLPKELKPPSPRILIESDPVFRKLMETDPAAASLILPPIKPANAKKGQKQREQSKAATGKRKSSEDCSKLSKKQLFQCPDCPWIGNTFSQLKSHTSHHHKDNTDKIVLNDTDKKRTCIECGFQAPDFALLQAHKEKNHTSISKTVRCSVDNCGKEFSNKERHLRHKKRVHPTPEELKKRANCPHCNVTLADDDKLKLHVKRVHDEEFRKRMLAQFKCNECGKQLANFSGFMTHVKSHDVNSRTQCGICGQVCSSKESLRQHVRLGHFKSLI